jgi:hypothetical protein
VTESIPPCLVVLSRARLRTPMGTLKCDLAEASRAAEHIDGAVVETSWISLHEGGVVVLGPWTPVGEFPPGRRYLTRDDRDAIDEEVEAKRRDDT